MSNAREELTMGTTLLPPYVTAGDRRDQAMAALAQANRVRLRRASLMRWMHDRSAAESHERAAELTLEPDPTLYSMLVLELLQRIRQVGPAQAERMLERADVSPTATLAGLTARQRAGLAALLRFRADQLSPHHRQNGPR
jgi:hypothetical protein